MNSAPSNRKPRKPLFLRVLKVAIFLFLGFVFMLILATGALYIYKDEVGEKILLRTNNIQQGKISFSDVTFSPFVHFPSVSVHLHDVVYLEHAVSVETLANDTIARLNSLYASIDLIEIIKGDINVSKITLDGGDVRIVTYTDSTINLLNAIRPNVHPDNKNDQDSTGTDDILTILLKEISIQNITINSLNLINNKTATVRIDKLNSSFGYEKDTIQCALNTTAKLISIPVSKQLQLKDKTIAINTAIYFNKSNQNLSIHPSQLIFENSNFQFKGLLNLSTTGLVDLKITGAGEDLSIFNLLLTQASIKNIKSGKIYFNGSIQGSYNEGIPCFDFVFGFKNLNLDIPDKNQGITDLNLEGSFNTGKQKDLSQAKLKIKNFNGKLPDGYINASLDVENFKFPKINLLLDMKADITGFDEIFSIGEIEKLSGRIEIFDEFTGSVNLDSMIVDEGSSVATIVLDSLSFNLPGIMNILNLEGQLHQNKDTIHFHDLSLKSDHTDLLINGRVYNLAALITGCQKEISADLKIKADILDLPKFLSFAPNVNKNFPYRILNMDLDVHAWSTTEKLLKFDFNPEINFKINQLDGTIENLFPPVSIKQGDVLLSEKDQRIFMTFDNFDLSIADGQINTNVEYFSPEIDPDEISVSLELSGLNPGKLLFFDRDTVSPLVDGNLSGKLTSKFEIGRDSIDFTMFDVLAEKLNYTTQKDTIDFNGLSIKAQNIFLGPRKNYPIGNLSLTSDIAFTKAYTNYFKLGDMSYKIDAKQGVITVHPERTKLFDKDGKGIYVLSPFADVPNYNVKYSVKQSPINTLLSNFTHDTLLSGAVDIELNLTLTENDKSDILSGLDGYIHIYGKDLFMYGLDLDKVIKKFQKTQRFSLVDIGAVALAGPFGLALTKGSQYANLAINKSNDTTLVQQLISEWNITSGKILLDDVAFTTEENRIVGTGWINLCSDSLKVIVSVVDINGCSILSQSIHGPLEKPKQSETKIVGTVLAPITNLVGGALGKDCKVIYNGKLEHPLKKKKG